MVPSNDAIEHKLFPDNVQGETFSSSTMTNSSLLLISSFFPTRYDVRATLESAPCEADDSFMNRLKFLSPAEQQAEQMAEKERYYSLYTNEVEEELYKGERRF